MFTGNFPGFRCLGTRVDGSQFWVDIPVAGPPMFLNDYASAGSKGALLTPKAEPLTLNLSNYGYNQVRLLRLGLASPVYVYHCSCGVWVLI